MSEPLDLNKEPEKKFNLYRMPEIDGVKDVMLVTGFRNFIKWVYIKTIQKLAALGDEAPPSDDDWWKEGGTPPWES